MPRVSVESVARTRQSLVRNAGVLVPALGVKSGSFEGSAALNEDQGKPLRAGQAEQASCVSRASLPFRVPAKPSVRRRLRPEASRLLLCERDTPNGFVDPRFCV